jgi:membrane-associated phospholipid phosphatase
VRACAHLALLLTATSLHAQTSEPGYWAPFKGLPKAFAEDQKAIWTAPVHSSKSDIKWWVIFGGATAALIATDAKVMQHVPTSGTVVNTGTNISDVAAYAIWPVSAALYFGGTHAGDQRMRETGYLGMEALADAWVVSTALKAVTVRERPDEGNGNGSFWQGSAWNSSFPSGHAIQSWSLATVVAREYQHKKWVPITAYSLAATVSVSRVLARRHFPSDVVVGSALGWFIGNYVYRKHHDEKLTGWRKVFDYVSIGGYQQ